MLAFAIDFNLNVEIKYNIHISYESIVSNTKIISVESENTENISQKRIILDF